MDVWILYFIKRSESSLPGAIFLRKIVLVLKAKHFFCVSVFTVNSGT